MGTDHDLIERAAELQARLDEYRERVDRCREWQVPVDAATTAEGARLRADAVAMYRELAIAGGIWNEGEQS